MHQAGSLIQETYHEEYFHSKISHHFFVKMAPKTLQEAISNFVWTPRILKHLDLPFGSASDIGSLDESAQFYYLQWDIYRFEFQSRVALCQSVFFFYFWNYRPEAITYSSRHDQSGIAHYSSRHESLCHLSAYTLWRTELYVLALKVFSTRSYLFFSLVCLWEPCSWHPFGIHPCDLVE
jgi:hypothetical protein